MTGDAWGARPLRAIALLLSGRPLMAAAQCGVDRASLERASRIAGQGGPAKRGARLGLYVAMRAGRAMPGAAWVGAAARRTAPRLHDALLRRYVAYSSNAGDWEAPAPVRHIMPGAHEAAILRRLQRMTDHVG